MFKNIIAWFSGKKTYVLVVLGALAIIVQWAAGDLTFIQFVTSTEMANLLELLGLGALRLAIAKALGK